MIDYIRIALFTILSSYLGTDELKLLGPKGCIYFEAEVDFENSTFSSDVKSIDTCQLLNGNMETLDIVFSEQFKELHKEELLSGLTEITANGAIIKSGTLLFPDESQVQLKKIAINSKGNRDGNFVRGRDDIHMQIGIKKVFVLRADALDSKTSANRWKLSNDIFGNNGDITNLKYQYEACSHGQLIMEPIKSKWNGHSIYAGVGEVELNMKVKRANKRKIQQAMMEAANEKYGNLPQKVNSGELDFIMFCLPKGTSGDWVAYAGANTFYSVYNNNYCSSLSVQVHEVGHNLGLAHSGKTVTYDDLSDMMGYSTYNRDGPLKCFNGAKSWQLGWYSNGHETITPLKVNADKLNYSGRLIGVAEYELLDTTSKDKVIVQITGYEVDYYVTFNAKKGANSETGEGGNQVLVHSRNPGQSYEESTLLAKLSTGQHYTILGILGSIVRVDNIITAGTPSYASVFIGVPPCASDSDCDGGELCTEYKCDVSTGTCSSTQDCSKCGGNIDIEIMTDRYGKETSWEFVNVDNDATMMKGGPYPTQLEFLEIKSRCVGYGKYEFRINDKDKGICCDYGSGYYKLAVDGEVIKEGGAFTTSSEVTSFEIVKPDTYTCAKENKYSQECGANKDKVGFKTCCSGLICNTNKRCVKEENYGCSWKGQTSKECGSGWFNAPDVCCSDFVCDHEAKKCVEPTCAVENKYSQQCGVRKADFETCCPGLICNSNKFCVKQENYGCSWKNQVSKECGSGWLSAPDVCCSGFVCDFAQRKCVQS